MSLCARKWVQEKPAARSFAALPAWRVARLLYACHPRPVNGYLPRAEMATGREVQARPLQDRSPSSPERADLASAGERGWRRRTQPLQSAERTGASGAVRERLESLPSERITWIAVAHQRPSLPGGALPFYGAA